MKPTSVQHSTFLAQELLPGLMLRHNEVGKVISGENTGSIGSIVSVEELGDDPVYLMELESGSDVRVRQSQLARP